MTNTKSIDRTFDAIASLLGETVMGGSPFYSEEKNREICEGAYDEAKRLFTQTLTTYREEILEEVRKEAESYGLVELTNITTKIPYWSY